MSRSRGLVERGLDRAAGDLVEDHPLHRHLGLQHLEHVPGDRLALAVLVGREDELVGVLERPLQIGDDLLLSLRDHVLGSEVVVDVDRQPERGRSRMWPMLAFTS